VNGIAGLDDKNCPWPVEVDMKAPAVIGEAKDGWPPAGSCICRLPWCGRGWKNGGCVCIGAEIGWD
jgi:hypothetical protein